MNFCWVGTVRILALAGAVWLAPIGKLLAAPFLGMVVFGDSLSDTGNVPSSPPYFEGRWSNGPLYVDHLAARLGLPAPVASSAGGSNYARFDATTVDVAAQTAEYLGGHVPGGDELFVIYAGANDFFSAQLDPAVPAANVADQITALATAGATQFLVPNLPPLGQVPAARKTIFSALLNDLTTRYNQELATRLTGLEAGLGITIFTLDVFAFTQQALADPAAFGLSNVTDPALDEDTQIVVPNPEEYLFWDGAHPSATAHRALGELAAAAVPEPFSLVLCSAGIALMAVVVRHRRNA